MRVGILGSGLMGGKLGTICAGAGTPDEAAKHADTELVVGHTSSGSEELAYRFQWY